MHLQPSQRRAQLMRGVCQKALLHRIGVAQMTEQLIECNDHGRDLDWRRALSKRTQIAWRSGQQFAPQVFKWEKPPSHTEPGKRNRAQRNERCRHQFRNKNFPDQPIPNASG